MTYTHRRRLAAAAVVAGLVGAAAPALAAPAYAAQRPASAPAFTRPAIALDPLDRITRAEEVRFAEGHWSWTAWNDPTPVAAGADQPDYQCAEFVARAMAAAGLIPGLSPDAPQNDYFDYTAPNGKTYDLLLISVLPQYHNLYDYLMDSGVGIDVGDDPADARPGDIVVTYLGPNGTSSHMGLVVTAPTATGEATVDAHNHARYHYGYHFYAPSHLVRLAPDALLEVWLWAAGYGWHYTAPNSGSTTQRSLVQIPGDPAGPQV